MEKLTFAQLIDVIGEHNADYNIWQQYQDDNPLICVIVFKNESWPNSTEDYSLESRSYEFRSDEKYFLSCMEGQGMNINGYNGIQNQINMQGQMGMQNQMNMPNQMGMQNQGSGIQQQGIGFMSGMGWQQQNYGQQKNNF